MRRGRLGTSPRPTASVTSWRRKASSWRTAPRAQAGVGCDAPRPTPPRHAELVSASMNTAFAGSRPTAVMGPETSFRTTIRRRMERHPAVYILASGKHGTLYIGVTSNLMHRLHHHPEGALQRLNRSDGRPGGK